MGQAREEDVDATRVMVERLHDPGRVLALSDGVFAIIYLLPLCLLPFGAGMLGRYDTEPVALRIYGLLLVLIAVMRVVIWLYATNRPQLLWQRPDARQRRAGLAVNLYPGLIYLLAFLIAQHRAGGEPGHLRGNAAAVLPQHHRPARQPAAQPGVRRLHLGRHGAEAQRDPPRRTGGTEPPTRRRRPRPG